jgi:hypothetical protein
LDIESESSFNSPGSGDPLLYDKVVLPGAPDVKAPEEDVDAMPNMASRFCCHFRRKTGQLLIRGINNRKSEIDVFPDLVPLP